MAVIIQSIQLNHADQYFTTAEPNKTEATKLHYWETE